uniref:Uncharacterized protein n=1 Tax=Glossina austeni TaxID=7395 RepID=A0A1A9V0T5_GLOAU
MYDGYLYLFALDGFCIKSSTVKNCYDIVILCAFLVMGLLLCYISGWTYHASGQLIQNCGSLAIETPISDCLLLSSRGFSGDEIVNGVKYSISTPNNSMDSLFQRN